MKIISEFNFINDAVAQAINYYLIGFATNGFPGAGIPRYPEHWSEFSLPDEDTMFFQQNGWEIIHNSGDAACEFWNDVGYFWLKD